MTGSSDPPRNRSGRGRYRHRMHRAFMVWVAALLLGVLTTVGIAWAFAWTELRLAAPYLSGSDSPRLVTPIPAGAGGPKYEGGVVSVERAEFPGTELWTVTVFQRDWLPASFVSRGDLRPPSWVRGYAKFWDDAGRATTERVGSNMMIARGWPVPTMWSEAPVSQPEGLLAGGALYLPGRLANLGPRRDLSILPSAASFPAPFPLRPIWLPFLVSSAVTGVAWRGLLHAPGMARRAWRRRRGLCTRCAYARTGLDATAPCPECGLAGSAMTGVSGRALFREPPAARSATRSR
jgi:hypothetical protein